MPIIKNKFLENVKPPKKRRRRFEDDFSVKTPILSKKQVWGKNFYGDKTCLRIYELATDVSCGVNIFPQKFTMVTDSYRKNLIKRHDTIVIAIFVNNRSTSLTSQIVSIVNVRVSVENFLENKITL